MSARISEEDPERQVQDGDTVDGDEPQGSSMIRKGDLVAGQDDQITRVWGSDLTSTLDLIQQGDIALVVEASDRYGWTRVMTARGIAGLVHRNNLQRLLTKK